MVGGGGRHNTKLPGPCENEEKKTKTQSVIKEKKKKLHTSQLLFPFLLVSFLVESFLNGDLDAALVSGGAAAEAGEEVGNVVLETLLEDFLKSKCRKWLTQG